MEHRAGRPAVRPANVSAAAARRIASRRAGERSTRFAALRVEPVDRLEPVTADRVATTEDAVRDRHHLIAADIGRHQNRAVILLSDGARICTGVTSALSGGCSVKAVRNVGQLASSNAAGEMGYPITSMVLRWEIKQAGVCSSTYLHSSAASFVRWASRSISMRQVGRSGQFKPCLIRFPGNARRASARSSTEPQRSLAVRSQRSKASLRRPIPAPAKRPGRRATATAGRVASRRALS
jgi:hypothetical protein